jgi:hypothetical protein
VHSPPRGPLAARTHEESIAHACWPPTPREWPRHFHSLDPIVATALSSLVHADFTHPPPLRAEEPPGRGSGCFSASGVPFLEFDMPFDFALRGSRRARVVGGLGAAQRCAAIVAAPFALLVACSAAPASPQDDSAPSLSQNEASRAPSRDETAESLPQNLIDPFAAALTRAQAKTALKLIDDICGDTWCEGDDDFRFAWLGCSARASSCMLVFKMFPRDTDPNGDHAPWRTCRTGGFTGFDSLVETTDSGYQSLQDAFYMQLTTCISDWEGAQ